MWRLVMCRSHFRLIRSGATLLYHVVLGCADSLRHRKHVTSVSTGSLAASDAGSVVSGLPGMLVSPVGSGGGQQPVVPGPLRVTNTPPASNRTDDADDDRFYPTVLKISKCDHWKYVQIPCPHLQTTLTRYQLLSILISTLKFKFLLPPLRHAAAT